MYLNCLFLNNKKIIHDEARIIKPSQKRKNRKKISSTLPSIKCIISPEFRNEARIVAERSGRLTEVHVRNVSLLSPLRRPKFRFYPPPKLAGFAGKTTGLLFSDDALERIRRKSLNETATWNYWKAVSAQTELLTHLNCFNWKLLTMRAQRIFV